MTEIATEDDLWKLFSKEPKDHSEKGDGFILWEALNQILAAKTFGDGTQALKIENEDRLYHIVGRASEKDAFRKDAFRTDAVVRQCDLRKVGRALSASSGGCFVGYLGLRK